MSTCSAQDSDVSAFYLFTAKSLENAGTSSEKPHCTIHPSEKDIKHVVEVLQQFAGGTRYVRVTGSMSGKCSTFNDPGVGSRLASWSATDAVNISKKFYHVSFEHQASGGETVTAKVEELNMFQNPPTFHQLDQGQLVFNISLA